jgi:hypothetical protein
MNFDCTLDSFKVPGMSGISLPFGTKNPNDVPIWDDEAVMNAAMPFTRQRPFIVTENSATSQVQAPALFVFQTAGLALTLGSGGFIGCQVRIMNVSDGVCAVSYSETEKQIKNDKELTLGWDGTVWVAAQNSGTEGGVNLAEMVEGYGRNLLDVFGISTIAEAMAEIHRLCNNNGEIDDTGIPDFTGIEIGDYIDGIDLSAIPAENSGTAGQAWNDTYKNNRIVVSGFNTYKGMGDTENTKNHVLFTFRNIPLNKRMNSSDTNASGYIVSELRAFLEGVNGDGTGDKSGVTTAAFMNVLKAQIGDYLYTIRKEHSVKSGSMWTSYTVWPVSEIEMFGVPVYGDEGVYMPAITSPSIAARASAITPVHIPLYQKSYAYRVKRYNGARDWHFLQTPYAAGASSFCNVSYNGNTNYYSASSVGGCAPAFCVA